MKTRREIIESWGTEKEGSISTGAVKTIFMEEIVFKQSTEA